MGISRLIYLLSLTIAVNGGIIEENEPNLRERLSKLKFKDSEGPLLARIDYEFPSFTDIHCEPVTGRKG